MKFNKKRGFTIVELIIVIAVIAILAAVLIPVFSNLIQQGKDADSKVLVNTLNKGVAMSGKNDYDTMHEVLAVVEQNVGVDVAKLNAAQAKGNTILWDSTNKTFVFLKSDGTYVAAPEVTRVDTAKYNLWKISDNTADLTDENGYSIYWTGENLVNQKVVNGFDAGSSTVESITYENNATAKSNIVIRTNGGVLTVNAPKDSVNHYGESSYVYVQDIYTESYHEHGNVDVVKIDKGHIVLEGAANVGSVELGSETTSASLSVKSGATVTIVAKGNENSTIDNKSGSEIREATTEEKETSKQFEGGFGTETSPYLVKTSEQFDQIYEMYKNGNVGLKYFALLDNIDVGNLKKWDDACENTYSVVLNGNGYTLSATPYAQAAPLFGIATNCVFTDLKLTTANDLGWSLCWQLTNVDFNNVDVVYPENVVTFNYGFSAYSCNVRGNINFIDCDIKANVKIDSKYAGLFIGNYIQGDTNCKFVNCTFDGEFRGPQVSMFIGNTNNGNKYSHTFVIENCSNYGNIVGTVSATYFSTEGGVNCYEKDEANATLQGVTKQSGKLFLSALENGAVTLTVGENNEYILNSNLASTYKYKVSLVSGISLYQNGELVGSSYVMIDKTFTSASNLATGMYKANVISDNLVDEKQTYGNDVDSMNGRHYVYDSALNRYIIETNDGTYDGKVNGKLSALVYVYDASGVLVGTVTEK